MNPKLYSELAPWWPLVSPVGDYELEARGYRELLAAADGETVLELGCGGGHTAAYLKHHFLMTLTDVAPAMVAESRKRNPACEHIIGDMRTLRLGRTFAAVFVHDAVCYMTTAADLHAALATAAEHCRPGGRVVIVPDCTRETFEPGISTGGIDDDDDDRGLRFLEWTHDPNPDDTNYLVDYAFLLRDEDRVRHVHDRHELGLFARDEWLTLLRSLSLHPEVEIVATDDGDHEVFVARRDR